MSDPTAIRRIELVQGAPGPVSTVPGPAPVTTTSAPFTIPASGASVTLTVGTTAFVTANQAIFIGGAGDYVVDSVTDATHLVAINLDTPGSAAPGTIVASGARVTCNGYPGAGTEAIGATTNATPTAIALDMSWLAPNTSFRLDVVVIARSATDEATFTLTGLFRKDGASVLTQTGTVQSPSGGLSTSGAAAWTGGLGVSGSSVNVNVTGAASTAIGWAVLGQIVRRTGQT